MTDRLKGCTVAFEHDIRVDDAESLLNAIRSIRGVLKVEPSLATTNDWIAEMRIRQELGAKLIEMVYPQEKK